MMKLIGMLCASTMALATAHAAAPEDIDGGLPLADDLALEADLAEAKADPLLAEPLGRPVKWQGVLQTGLVQFQPDCSGVELGPDDRCITTTATGTSFDERDIGRVTLPAKSANSLLCQWVTPFLRYRFQNGSASNQTASFLVVPSITIENDVLGTPGLTDPGTGLPLAGALEIGLSASHQEMRTLAPGHMQLQRLNYSRVCIGGIVNPPLLQSTGMTPAQIEAFFKKPITIRFHLRGSAQWMTDGFLTYGLRIVTD